MPERAIGEKQLFYLEFINRENQVRHQTRDQDKLPYELLRDAKPQAVEAGMAAFRAHLPGQLSQDPLRSDQYYFVAGIALCCRYCMEGGLNEERAYNICDLYIQRMDTQQTREQVEVPGHAGILSGGDDRRQKTKNLLKTGGRVHGLRLRPSV